MMNDDDPRGNVVHVEMSDLWILLRKRYKEMRGRQSLDVVLHHVELLNGLRTKAKNKCAFRQQFPVHLIANHSFIA